MLAIDTNVLVRLIVTDDARQAEAVRALFRTEEVLVSSTVILEAEWVLRRGYGLGRPEVLRVLQWVCGLPRVILAEPHRLKASFEYANAGMDFADALHLAGGTDCEAFVTFDRKLAKTAARLGDSTVRLL